MLKPDQTTDKTPNPWPLNGYAPGDYYCICHKCDMQFSGDKRAVTCVNCAVDALIKAKPVDTSERDRLKAVKAELNAIARGL